MTYLDYREQTFKYQNEAASFYPGVQPLLRPFDNQPLTTVYYCGGNHDQVRYFQRIARLLKIDLNFEFLDLNQLEQPGIHLSGNHITGTRKTIFFEDLPDFLPYHESPQYRLLTESGINPKNVAIFSSKCLALDQKTFQCTGEFGFVMKKFFFYNFPQDWMLVFADGESMPLKDWLVS